MPTLNDVRKQYPQYQDMSDQDLADAMHRKFYSDMPKDQFYAKLDYKGPVQSPPGPEPDMASDIVQSAGTGIRKGIETTLGGLGDAAQTTGDVAQWVAKKMGAGDTTASMVGGVARNLNPAAMLPTTEDVQQLTNAAIGQPRQPQTTAGKYAESVGEFAPNAAMGPGGIVRKTAMAVLPGVLSEGAAQLAEGIGYENLARTTGAIVGGGLAAGKGTINEVKVAAKGAPTAEALKSQTDGLYDTLRQAGIKYDANAFGQALQSTTDKLLKAGYRPSVAPQAFGYLDDLSKSIGHSPDFDDINGLVQVIGQEARAAARSPDGAGRAAALNIVRDGLMKFEEVAPLASQVPMPAAQMNQIRKAARQTALQRIKGRTLDSIAQDAETYQSGQEAGIRNGISNLLRSERGKQLFNGDERKALMEVANGRKGLRTLSRFGLDLRSIGGNATMVPTMGATLATVAGGGLPAGAALVGAGTIAKELSPYLTSKAFEQARAAVRSGKLRDGSLMNAKSAEQIKANVRRLLALEAARGQDGGQ